ncbi:MAG: hypothetical protein PHE25_02660 [Candidatus Gracilibacteria bacterium]|nr:hypothetical protein [Candidatus Gracilibacteria bacterium]
MKHRNLMSFIGFIILIILTPSIFFCISNLSFNNNFVFSNNINNLLGKIFKNNDLLKFKKGDYYYKAGDYQKAINKYLGINCKNDKDCFILNYNIGNSFYKYGASQNILERLSAWQRGLGYYKMALNINYNEQAKKNYDFVLSKINELLDEIKREQNKNNKEDNEKKDNAKKTEEKTNSSVKKDDVIPKGQTMVIDDNFKNLQKPLSSDEKKQINQYINSLIQEEKQNIELNKPKESENIYDILEKDFGGIDNTENDW